MPRWPKPAPTRTRKPRQLGSREIRLLSELDDVDRDIRHFVKRRADLADLIMRERVSQFVEAPKESRTMLRRVVMVVVLVWLGAGVAFAQNPCTTVGQNQFYFNPTLLNWTTDDFNATEADGSFRVSGLRYAVFEEGANPATATPIQGPSSIPRASISLVPGTTNCYQVSLPALIPDTRRLVASAKQYRDANPTTGLPAGESAWSPASNPFGSAPSVLAAPGLTRVSR